jgi:hypothetical protein
MASPMLFVLSNGGKLAIIPGHCPSRASTPSAARRSSFRS